MRKRLIKRSLEFVGAIAIVYILLDLLESHAESRVESNFNTKSLKEKDPLEKHLQEIQKLNLAIQKVQEEQALQKSQMAVQPPVVQANPAPKQVQVADLAKDEGVRLKNNIHAAPAQSAENEKAKPKPPPKPIGKLPAKPVNKPLSDAMKPAVGQGKVRASPSLGVNTNFEKLNLPEPKLKSNGYVLPMLYFDMGPNNLFRLFRQGVVTAYEMGRTVTVPVFHRHPRMGDAAEDPFVLPIFDTNYTVDLVWPPSETVDLGALRKFMSVSSMKDMKKDCKGKLDVVVKCGTIDSKRYSGIEHFQRAADMKVLKEIEIASYEELVPNDLSAGIISPDEAKCMGIVYGKKCLPDQDRWLATFSKIAKYYWRPLPVRKFSMSFIENVMGNRKFMAVHWRYESDWLDMCKPSRPKGARERNREICRITMGLTYDDDVRNSFIQAIKDKLADYNLKTIFLASPPNNIDLIRLFNQSFPGNFFYFDDVEKYALKTEGPDFMTNNYKTSFIEQEICFSEFILLDSLSINDVFRVCLVFGSTSVFLDTNSSY